MKKKAFVIVITLSSVVISLFTISIFLTVLFFQPNPYEYNVQEFPIIGSTNFEDLSNEKDYTPHNWTIEGLTSNLTYTNRIDSKIFGLAVINSTWDGTNWSVSYICKVNYAYNDSFINSIGYELHIARSGDFPPCEVYFWNYTGAYYQYNTTTVWGLNFILAPDFYSDGEILFKLNATSLDWFSILPYGYYHFNYDIFVSDNIIIYGDLGNGFKNIYDNITWNSNQDVLDMYITWSSSVDNVSWSNNEPRSTFSGFGERYLRLNVSLSVFSSSYSCDINVTFQNCSYDYYKLNKTVSVYQNNSLSHIKDKVNKKFNLSLVIGYSDSLFNRSIYLYNFNSSVWEYMGDLALNKIENLNFINYIDEVEGIKIRFIAHNYNEFAISYNIIIIVKVD